MESIIIPTIVVLIFLLTIYKLTRYFWMKWFDSTLPCYTIKAPLDGNPNILVPLSFKRDGIKYEVYVKHEKNENQILGTKMSRSYVFINGNAVLMISRMKPLFITVRSVDADLKYCSNDVFKVLKWAREHWFKNYSYVEGSAESISLIEK